MYTRAYVDKVLHVLDSSGVGVRGSEESLKVLLVCGVHFGDAVIGSNLDTRHQEWGNKVSVV